MLKYNIGYSAENPEWVGTLKDESLLISLLEKQPI